jgi:DNA-binding FadR family transcriptional regulator
VRAQGAEELTLAEHARVIDAIAARDPEAAERAVREHLTRANSLYRQLQIDASRQEEAARAANAA